MSYIILDLTINWIRHGFSCANYLYLNSNYEKIYDKTKDYLKTLAPDAKLTKSTLDKFENINNNMNEYQKYILESDYYCCSELTRAIETSIFLFSILNKTQIYIIKYIGEEVETSFLGKSDNLPSTHDNIEKNINNAKMIYKNIFKKDIQQLNIEHANNDEKEKYTGPDFNNFLSKVLPFFIKKNKDKIKNNRLKLSFSIVSHRNFIKNVTNIGLNNLAVIQQGMFVKYNIDKDKYTFDKKYNIKYYKNINHKNIEILNKKNYNEHGSLFMMELDVEPTTKIDISNCDFELNSNGKIIKK
jgi:hypothetical protein